MERTFGRIFFSNVQSNSDIEGMFTYSTVPGLGKQRGKRENIVNMRGRQSVGGGQRDIITQNIKTKEKKEGRPMQFLMEPKPVNVKPEGLSMTHRVDSRTSV